MKRFDHHQCSKWMAEGLWGFLPTYQENGNNGSSILFRGRPPLYNRRQIRSHLHELAALYHKDIRLIRDFAAEYTGQKTMNPLPFSANVLLVPFKIRKPVGRDDGAVGYLFVTAIAGMESSGTGTSLVLKDESRLQLLETLCTVKRRVQTARNMQAVFSTQMPGSHPPIGNTVQEGQEVYNLPATKGDLVLLSQSILQLASHIKLQKF